MEILLTINPITLLLSVFAVYRITAIVVDDRVFDSIRDFIFAKFGTSRLQISYLITCYWCLSFWVGLLVALPMMLFLPFIWGPLAFVLTASAVAGMLGTVIPR